MKTYHFAYTVMPALNFLPEIIESPEIIEWMRVHQEQQERRIRNMIDASFYEGGECGI